ncbi:MAG TPA: HAD family hydrolase, partial [Isosphaeraceae bacterium]|nr:HAD family hydrolase [Isosphaeraceae bacterium]
MSSICESRHRRWQSLPPGWPSVGWRSSAQSWGVVYVNRVNQPVISWTDGVIRLRDSRLIDAGNPAVCRAFVHQVFRLAEVDAVEIDWAESLALVRYAREGPSAAEVLARLAAVARGEVVPGMGPPLESMSLPAGVRGRVQLFRHGGELSTWDVASERPGRIRLRHAALAGDRELAHRLERELACVHGVIEAQARPLTASLLVQFDPAAISKRHLVQLLDRLVLGPELSPAIVADPPPVRFGLANGSVGLAAVGEFAVPALLPASAVLLVASNLKVIREAGQQLQRKQLGLPVLSTTIIAATLGTGQFLVAALMGWMLKFWRHRHRRTQARMRRHLLPSLTQRRPFARLRAGGAEIEVPTDRLQSGDRIVIVEGEMVPADGRLIGGPVVVDERFLRGIAGLTRKEPGDPVFAGSFLVEGLLELEVSGPVTETRAARLACALAAGVVPSPCEHAVTAHGEVFAQRAVAPTLATAGLGLIVGDIATALAILRLDYATGPGVGVALETLQDIAASARDGVIVRDPSAFAAIAAADLWLLDHHPNLERTGLEIESIRGHDTGWEILLRVAATAFRDLADDRATALGTACASCGLSVLEVEPSYRGPGITLIHQAGWFSIRDAPELSASPMSPPPLEISADGRVLGRITFRAAARPRAAEAIAALRRAGGRTIGLLSDQPEATAAPLAQVLGLDFHRAGLSSQAKADLLRACRDRGLKAVYVGDARREPRAAGAAHVAISWSDGLDPAQDPAQILVLRPDLAWIGPLRERSRSHLDRVRAVHGSILLPNLACIAGAFFLGFTSLSAVILTNLGTWA